MSMNLKELEDIRNKKHLDSMVLYLDGKLFHLKCFFSDKMFCIKLPYQFFTDNFNSTAFLEDAINKRLKELSNDI